MTAAARRAIADDVRDVWAPRAGTGPVTVLDVGDGGDGLLLAADGHQVVLAGGSSAGLGRRVDEARLGHRCTVLDALTTATTRMDLVLAHDVPLTADRVADLAMRVRPGGYVSFAGPVARSVDDAARWSVDAGLRMVARRDDGLWHLVVTRPR
ncbi:MAG: hypothetical protein Q7T56_03450 [Nocardioidaceae bacterium]|nr:hypothetical protein [Nocardioidaceae bacterium]